LKEKEGNIGKLTDRLFRQESGKLMAVLTKIFGTHNLQLVEDVLQETFVSALQTWRIKGVPDNPPAWIFRSAKNKAIDIIRKNRHSSLMDFNANEESLLLMSEYTLSSVINIMWTDEAMQDDLLKMMFACCHEELAIENQITLILKILCGFTTIEIAKAFLTSEDTISKRLYRTKEFFRERKIKPEFPVTHLLKARTEAVLKSIYLIFNEGYNSTNSDQLIRRDLIDQAMYLCGVLCNNPQTQIPDAFAAIALMCFHAARIESRLTIEGEIILLDQQDRTKWDQSMIRLGNEYMNKSAFGESLSSYHIEAAIAYEHCTAETFEQTNWEQILAYYDLLIKIYATPIVTLNRMAVLFKVKGGVQTLHELNTSPFLKDWEKHYLYHSLLAEIYSGGDIVKARQCIKKAMSLTKSEVERRLLQNKLERL
jgi:RNA polymerase sigma factor (sigma-70 family)